MKIPFKRTKAKLYLAGWSLITATLFTLLVTFLTADVKPSFFDSGIVALTPTGAELLAAQETLFHVIRVVDGDTIRVEQNGQEYTVRLLGIDTPESVDPRKTVQCFAHEATAQLQSLIDDSYVRLDGDSSQMDIDRYGRLLRYVYSADGVLINKLMIEDGYAFEYTYDKPYMMQKMFMLAQEEAQQSKRGLWAESTCGGER